MDFPKWLSSHKLLQVTIIQASTGVSCLRMARLTA